ncbi:MAG TPA: DEAD/DEAH box helicase [Candidatus Limnocylindria bacterium]|nr:DEAD/DEAH box helicase [Candidatus Limnocylindria bacterium]
MPRRPPTDPLAPFSPHTRAWFSEAFEAPTDAQARGWAAISAGRHALIHAPTGSGKTLAAFLWCVDRLMAAPRDPKAGTRVLYVSPLKALTYDVERNLRAPLAGIRRVAERAGGTLPEVSVASRTGDTPADARRALTRIPPDILVTTPESLYLMLTSQAREILRGVEYVIVDEVHAMAGTKRGAHLALSLERLDALVVGEPGEGSGRRPPQRIGLSATQRPLERIAAFLGGAGREVEVVDAGARKELQLEVVVPVEDMARMGEALDIDEAPGGPAAGPEARRSIWPSIHPRLLELIRAHRSTLIFVNSRRLAERLAARLNELAGEELVRAHHGSVAREQRLEIEEALKAGRLPALVATSSLELGIDMGAIDLVVQVEAPPSVASGLQRIGRAGHQVGEASKGTIFPKFRGDLLEAAVIVPRMEAGQIEETLIPRTPLDVLAQQVVAMCSQDVWTVDALHALVTRAESYRELSREQLEGVLDMLAGRYPSDEFAELKPRIVWDRSAGTLQSRNDARVVAVTSGGTIPDRGLYGVFLPDGDGKGGRRVGELDEEMVYESRVGEVFLLGASSWRIEEIRHDRVIVTPAPGEPGKMPFWHGDLIGRPIELGRAIGAAVRELEAMPAAAAEARLRDSHRLDELAARNLVQYLADQREATGVLPTDRTIVLERFRDELGDWRVCLLTPFGGRVHAPWAMAVEARLAERGLDAQTIWTDDGIAVRLPEADETPAEETLVLDPDQVEEILTGALGSSALFAARFRENAARALLLPRRRPGQRTPLWMQRQKSADLLSVASRYGSFPILLETYREVLRDVFDLPALREVLSGIRSRQVRVVSVETRAASPFAQGLVFDYVASYLYEGDAPLAERRAQALALDRELLAELLGTDELRELLDPEAIATLELELQALAEGRQAKSADGVHDLLRRVGDLRVDEVAARVVEGLDAGVALAELRASKRAVPMRIAGEERWVAIEDVARYRDALGASPPRGVAELWLEEAEAPLAGLLQRWARTHAPFTATAPAARWGLGPATVADALRALVGDGRLIEGAFRPGATEHEFADPEIVRALRRRSLARLRREIEPVPAEALGRFLPAWHGVGSPAGGLDRLLEVVTQLEGAPIPASILERDVLRARVRDYTPRLLDELGAAGEVVWVGRGSLNRDDGRIALYRRDRAELLASAGAFEGQERPDGEIHEALRAHLSRRGASFYPQLRSAAPGARSDDELLDALWDLVWAGEVTNDTFAPLRALTLPRTRSKARTPRPGRLLSMGPPRAAGRWSLVADLVGESRGPTERGHATAVALLERHGVLTREAVLAENVVGGFASVYPILRAMEESGRARRGYFVDGLGAAQFALPGAVDRLRAARDTDAGDGPMVTVLAAADPAQPYGAALAWPRRDDEERLPLQRAAGAYVVLVDGRAALYLERGGRSLFTLPAGDDPDVAAPAVAALARLVAPTGPMRELAIERVDRLPPAESALAEALRAAGFRPSYRAWVLRPTGR